MERCILNNRAHTDITQCYQNLIKQFMLELTGNLNQISKSSNVSLSLQSQYLPQSMFQSGFLWTISCFPLGGVQICRWKELRLRLICSLLCTKNSIYKECWDPQIKEKIIHTFSVQIFFRFLVVLRIQ